MTDNSNHYNYAYFFGHDDENLTSATRMCTCAHFKLSDIINCKTIPRHAMENAVWLNVKKT